MSTAQSLKDSGLKATLPRRKILELFEASKVRHLSAEDVYKALLAEGIDIGLATVYRVLTQFEQAGLLARQHFETGKAVFELNQGGDLRQVGDAEHLALLAEASQRPADRLGDAAADAGIDLVENQRADRRSLRRDHLDRQADARELASGGDPRERAQRQARVRGDLELDFLGPRRSGFVKPVQQDLEPAARHRELLHARRHRLRKRLRAVLALRRELLHRGLVTQPRAGHFALQRLGVDGQLELREALFQLRMAPRQLLRPHPVPAGGGV